MNLRFYIVEDDLSVIGVLEDIVERCNLGIVCGSTEKGPISSDGVLSASPDIVLVDLLMPDRDGIQVVRDLKDRGCTAKFIMISQVTSKDLIAKAYMAGVDFFIQKPINLIEVRQVITNIGHQIENERALDTIRSVLPHVAPAPPSVPVDSERYRRKIQYELNQLGMTGEKGSADILEMCIFLLERGERASTFGIGALCAQLSDSPKSMEQRVRRTAERCLSHIASVGLEDYDSEIFTRYASVLFPFPEVRSEMDLMRATGQSRGGRVNLKKFLDGLLLFAEEA